MADVTFSGNCGTCKYWKTYSDGDYSFDFDPVDLGMYLETDRADYPRIEEERRQWGTCYREAQPDSMMFTNDASHYFSALRTRSEFACIQYEERTEEESQ